MELAAAKPKQTTQIWHSLFLLLAFSFWLFSFSSLFSVGSLAFLPSLTAIAIGWWFIARKKIEVGIDVKQKNRWVYKKGQQACFEGIRYVDNPYDDESLTKEWHRGWEKAFFERQEVDWFRVIIPPLLLIPTYFIFDPHSYVRTCTPFVVDLVWIPIIVLPVGAIKLIQRLIKRFRVHRQDRRLYRSLLTVSICVGILFHYSQLGKRFDQLISDAAQNVQISCRTNGQCPRTIDLAQDLANISVFRFFSSPTYITNHDQSRFCINYCVADDFWPSWAGGVHARLRYGESGISIGGDRDFYRTAGYCSI